ncbi:hypothetical protein [Serratia sp. OS31]|nr:hypothetical protein [Serratia sp. OS31]
MSTSLFSKTPTVTVLDNRGLTVRDIAYQIRALTRQNFCLPI